MRVLLIFAFVVGFVSTNVLRAENIVHGVRVVVLDAGHGGPDPGCHYAGTREKDITLKVVLKLGALIEEYMPGVKVCYTRTTDRDLAPTKKSDLQARANFANKMNGDVFISVHVNAAGSSAAKGVETLIMGETPMEQTRNEAALMESNREDLFDMTDANTAAMVRAYIQNLQYTYGQYSMALAQCIQDGYKADGRHIRKIKPQPLMVLYATNMPCVLTEIGFLSNPQEAALMKSAKGIDRIARSLLKGLQAYSRKMAILRGETPVDYQEPKAESEQERPKTSAVQAQAPLRYTVQVMASDVKLPLGSKKFKSYRNRVKEYLGAGKLRYKYCVGEYRTLNEARQQQRKVRSVFHDAFVVKCRGGKIVK